MDQIYDRLLTARHSPKNRCHSADGEKLFLAPPPPEAIIAHELYNFTGATTGKVNLYGWVTSVEGGITIENFLDLIEVPISRDEEMLTTQKLMLDSIRSLPSGTPVVADFSKRGIPPQVALIVHKVFFYKRP